MRSATTAVWTRSPRYLGKMTPLETAPTWCPARPIRCSPLATEGGDSTCTTRSTAPMSMPSSRLEAAAEAFGQASGVGEDDGGAVRLDEVEELILDVRPDRALDGVVVGAGGGDSFAHVLERHHDAQVELLLAARLDDRGRAGSAQE